MTKPTAEEALEWLAGKNVESYISGTKGHLLRVYLSDGGNNLYHAPTPLEAIRNAMKGESDD